MARSVREKSSCGFYEIKDNPLSKVGVFPYVGSSLLDADDPDKIYQVYRPAEELGSQETIDSFKLLPWVDDHKMMGDTSKGYTSSSQHAIHGVIGEDVTFDGHMLRGNLKLFSEDHAKIIEGGKKELSCGYLCDIEFITGEFDGVKYDAIQRNIRGNHVASVAKGRMGSDVAVLDQQHKTMSITFDSKDFTMTEDDIKRIAAETATQVLVDAADAKKAEDDKMAKDAKMAEDDKMAKDAKMAEDAKKKDDDKDDKDDKGDNTKDSKKSKGEDAILAALDSIVTRLTGLEDNAEKASKTLAADADITARDALASRVADHVGTFDHAQMSAVDVAKYALGKFNVSCDSDEAAIPTLNGVLAVRKAPSADACFQLGSAQDGDDGESAISKFLSAAE